MGFFIWLGIGTIVTVIAIVGDGCLPRQKMVEKLITCVLLWPVMIVILIGFMGSFNPHINHERRNLENRKINWQKEGF